MGDFILLEGNIAVRVDGVFVHELQRVKRLFIKATKIKRIQGQEDKISKLSVYQFESSNSTILVGLPSIKSQHPYFIPVAREPDAPSSERSEYGAYGWLGHQLLPPSLC